jgi:MFS family permease
MPSGNNRLATLNARILDHPRYPRWLMLVTLTGMFATAFPGTILAISIKTIAVDLHSAPGTVTWVTTAPLLAAAVCTPVFGRIGDLRGHRRIYLIGLVVAGAFSLLTVGAWDAVSLIVFRTASQLGAAAMVPSTFAMLFRSFPEAERVRASAMASGTGAAASVVGVVIGGPLVDLIGWRPIFLIQGSIAFLALVPALLVLKRDDPVEGKKPVDYAGAVALATATFALTFGINRLGVWGPTPVTVGALIVVPIAVWLLIRIERRTEVPLLPLHIFSARNTWVAITGSFLMYGAWMGTFILTPLLLQSVMGLSVGITALIVVPRAASGMLIAPLAGRLGVRFGERRLVIVACIAVGVVTCLLAVAAATTMIAFIAIVLSLSGFAFACAQPGLVSAMGHSVSPRDFGLAVSLQQTGSQIGSVVGIGLFSAIGADATTTGPFVFAFLLSGAMCFLSAIIATRLHRTNPAPARIAGTVNQASSPAPLGSAGSSDRLHG